MQIEEEFALRARRRLVTGTSHGRDFMMRAARGGLANGYSIAGGLIGQMLAGADDGETFVVEQALDFKDGLDVLATIEAMAAGTFQGLERGEFRFPVTQDESFCRG